ncbi:unnamed protein product [Brachionus calyciflorus]|uniref:Uncharacterized protein n=1 Tax=Brachionus calyciflorus TaxID=104777 RepID=A0A813PY18_9BILA|nr:unnamed protein product [Brachionus calyciflorus]
MAKSARFNKLHICGPGLSICCSLMSIWGIIMLAIVGGLLSAKSAAFIEDIPKFEEEHNTTFKELLDKGYNQAATNCYGAVGLYGACLLFCGVQVFFNIKAASMNK